MNAVPNPSLEAGLAALEQGNYRSAIAHFEGVRETELDNSRVTRASMGLVRAYRGMGDTQSAIALCQNLTQHPNAKVREWAANTLTDLTPGQPSSPATSDATGFVPVDSTPPNPPASDSTGFVAFDPTSSTAKTPPRVAPSTTKQQSSGSTKPQATGRTRGTSPAGTGTPSLQGGLSNPTPTNRQASEPTQPTTASAVEDSSLSPFPHSVPSTPDPALFASRSQWRNSGRAKNWSPLKPAKLRRLWFVEIVTAIAFFWVLRWFVRFVMETTNTILVQLPFFEPIQPFYRDPTVTLLIVLAILLIVSPWLLDGLLKLSHGLKPLPLTQLSSRVPEAGQTVQRFCRQRKLPVPKLGILPTNAPVALTYGNLPWTARIVVSEGLLAQLAEDEVATIYMGQLGHIARWDFVLMSLGVLLIQIPYTIYWQVARWGERLADLAERKFGRFVPAVLRWLTGLIASLSYITYWLLRLPLLWFSRARVFYSDRLAVETTGNPNGLTRGLLKIAVGISEDIQTERQTSGLLESYDLMLPVGYRQAISLGSSQIAFESLLNWDCTNPYRNWLTIGASHPLIGDRLTMLARCAQFWKLDTELDLPPLAPPPRNNAEQLSKLFNSNKAFPLLQNAILYGLVLGIILRTILWIVGKIGDLLNIWQIIWMYNANPFLDACILAAFSLCVFIWINRYFPDIKPAATRTEPNLGELFSNPASLPSDSQPIQLTGQLLGRRSLLNWLGQDLIVQTSTGLVRLHFSPLLGPLGYLLPRPTRPSNLVNQQVTVTGWLRRGVTPWIDIDTLRSQSGKVMRANYPLWLTILALAAACWGAYLIWQA